MRKTTIILTAVLLLLTTLPYYAHEVPTHKNITTVAVAFLKK